MTRSLLGFGMVVGPFYLVVGLAQALLRDGFDLGRHPLSVLANGPGGWVQALNFLLAGAMVIAAATGIARVGGKGARLTAWFLGAFGAGMLVAAFFKADPIDGFPVGTPPGMPTAISTAGMVHFIAGGLGFLALALSALVAARMMSRRQQPAYSRLSLAAGIVVLLGFFGGPFLRGGAVLGIWLAVIAGWGWLFLLSRHLRREA